MSETRIDLAARTFSKPNAVPLDWNTIRKNVVASTSDLGKQIVLEGTQTVPLVVWAAQQTTGRGRGARRWWSDEGSLTFTIAINPAAHGLRAEHEPRLALATAVAVIEAVEPLVPGSPLGIRWPNDIEANDRKLGGILPERVETAGGPRLLIGVGLNVSTRLADAPPEVRRMATTLEELRGSPCPLPLAEILAAILGRFESVASALSRDEPTLAERWSHLDTLAGRMVRVDIGSRIVQGRAAGIDRLGALHLACQGETLSLLGGQVLRDL